MSDDFIPLNQSTPVQQKWQPGRNPQQRFQNRRNNQGFTYSLVTTVKIVIGEVHLITNGIIVHGAALRVIQAIIVLDKRAELTLMHTYTRPCYKTHGKVCGKGDRTSVPVRV